MTEKRQRYGLLLPHFGEQASRDKLIRGAQTAERYGFDSVWVRDHLVFHPHGMEGRDRTHIDPLVALALVAGATEKLVLGTGSLIPYRHPIHLALLEEQVAIIRRLWSGEEVSYEGKYYGKYYSFRGVDLHPSPSARGGIPLWYRGNSPASVRRAVEYCQGWMPGRITLKTFAKRMERMRHLADEAGKPMPTAAAIPITSPGRAREQALARVNWRGMLKSAAKTDWVVPESGRWESPDDLEGALIAGPPEHIIAETRKYHARGLEHLTYDLRFRFDDWDECVRMLGEEVLPELRKGDR